jgi:hypothetical protein
MNDEIAVVKADGSRFERLRAVVERNSIIFDDVDVPLDEGDQIERSLPGGRKELYDVLDAGFTKGGGGIPDFYHAKVRKTTSRLPQAAATTHVSVSGPNARVNLGSVDNSTNIVSYNGVADDVFRGVVDALRDAKVPASELARLSLQLETMQAAQGTVAYNRAYADFVQLAANWMTIIAPFIPALTRAIL